MSAADRHEAAVARRKANAIRQARAEEKRRLRTKGHGFHLSSYERESADFYATPPLLAVGLAIGLTRLGIALPQIALDPCGGNSALRRGLSPFGIELRLSDLYCEKYPGADGYVTHELLDAGHMESLRFALELAGANCRSVLTNSPHETSAAMAIVKNLVALVEEGRIDVVAMLFKNIWGDEKGRFALFDRPAFIGEIALCWRARWILNSKGSPEHAYTWFVWRRELRNGLAPKVRVSESEAIAATNAALSREAA